MRFFESEVEARNTIADLIRPHYPSAHLFIAERTAQNLGLREVTFVARVKKEEDKTHQLINAFYLAQQSNSESLSWEGTKIDFLNDEETEYIMVKAIVENGN